MVTWIGDTSPSTMEVSSGEDCDGITIVLTKGETGCGETIDASESEGPLGEPHASGISWWLDTDE
jgi:hypothetical protein